jgi:hypothetical protein
MVESTAQITSTTHELSDRFLILDKLRGLKNSRGTLHLGVRPGNRIPTGLIAQDMKQYYIIKKPKVDEITKVLNETDVKQL